VRGLVGQHRLPDDIADGEDVRYVGAHLRIDVDETALAHAHAGLVGIDLLPVRTAAHGHQHAVVDRALGDAVAFEAAADAVLLRPGLDHLRLQVHGHALLRHSVVQRTDQIPFGS